LSNSIIKRSRREFEMAQCEHEFKLDEKTDEVKCIKCGDYDDQMVIAIKVKEATAQRDINLTKP
jgi:hypothetical protein